MAHFIHQSNRPIDPAFLHEERLFLERERAALQVMERQHDQLVQDIEKARSLAKKAHIPIDRPVRVREQKLLAVIGIGDRLRRDDGAGPEVARRLRLAHPPGVAILEQEGEPTSLIEAWSDADEALVVVLPPAEARAFCVRATQVVSAGRPSCEFCAEPMDPAGHLCPRMNGFRRR